MIKFLKRKLRKWLSEDDCLSKEMVISSGQISTNRIDSSTGFNLRVYKASGGTVIETTVYDRHKDRHHLLLLVITDDKNLGDELNKIITMENLRA
jgi:deoxycytidine triphosphate deaminase